MHYLPSKKKCNFPEVSLLFSEEKKKGKGNYHLCNGKAEAQRGQENCSAELEKDHIADYHSSNLITSPVTSRAD